MIEFKLPAIGEGVVEVEIVRWLKQPGDTVVTNEGIVEVMTDKATVEIPSPHAGRVLELRTAEGVTVGIGETICTIETSTSATPRPSAPQDPAPQATAPNTTGNAERILATPAARALAREAGIDLGAVAAHDGRITKREVEQARRSLASPSASDVVATPSTPRPHTSAAPSTPPLRPPAATAEGVAAPSTPPPRTSAAALSLTERIPFRGVRRRTAETINRAFRSAVHYTYVDEVDVSRLVEVRNQAKRAAAADGVALNYLPFIVKAVLRGLKKFPIVNAQLDEEREEIIVHHRYDIGIATATEHGLVVPVLRDVDRKSLLDIAAEIHALVDAARRGQATREQLGGSTFTITSLGAIGGLHATPILNYPEVGILGVHAIRKIPVVDDQDRIVVGHVMNLSVSFDHRIVDGFEGASFLQEVKRYLEDPTLLLLAGI